MPPPAARRPDNATYDRVATWLENELDRAADAHVNPGRTAELHRLNRTEYANAVRDLLGVEIDPKAMLPPDEQAFGFDTNADALSMQPALLDRYLAAAAKIARLVVGDPTIPAGFERYTALKDNSNETTWLWQNERLGEEFPLGSRGGIVARHYFPVDGEYVFKIRLDRTDTGLIRGLRARSDIEIRVDGVRVGQLTVGGTPEFTAANANPGIGNYAESGSPLANADDRLEVRTPVKAGMRQVIATIVKADNVAVEGVALDADPGVEPRTHEQARQPAPHLGAAHWRAVRRSRVTGLARPAAAFRLRARRTAVNETACATKISVGARRGAPIAVR